MPVTVVHWACGKKRVFNVTAKNPHTYAKPSSRNQSLEEVFSSCFSLCSVQNEGNVVLNGKSFSVVIIRVVFETYDLKTPKKIDYVIE